eukprot:365668-Chlamydomonas_euryale.AAC.11
MGRVSTSTASPSLANDARMSCPFALPLPSCMPLDGPLAAAGFGATTGMGSGRMLGISAAALGRPPPKPDMLDEPKPLPLSATLLLSISDAFFFITSLVSLILLCARTSARHAF